MIDWIGRLPDTLTGILAAAGLWFGFNYAVLAERAMERDQAAVALPRCVAALGQRDEAARPHPSGLGGLLGLPDLDRLEALVMERAAPSLSAQEGEARCACALRRAGQRLRFDYAVHTASFRLVAPQAVSAFGDDALDVALAGSCAVLPALPAMRPGVGGG